jgi:flagellar hook protein FlgE
MPFRTALSGLNAASADLRVIGNNVANASTNGFKKSRTEFADIYAFANLGAGSNTIGSGVRVSNISQQFSQGNISFTDNNLDLAISGQGFFRLNDGGTNVFTRNGTFSVDRQGYIVNTQDNRLTGFLADNSGNITGALGDIQLDTSDIAPQATSTIDYGLNLNASATASASILGPFDVNDASTYNDSTSLTVYDSLGDSHLATSYYRKTANPNEWEIYTFVDGTQVNGAQANGSDLLQFDSLGDLQSINGTATPPATYTMGNSYTPTNGAAPITLTNNFSSLTQYGGGFNVNALTQNGYSTGRLSGINIDDTGIVQARFTNGQTRTLAQIALANFSNTQGLQQNGDTSWSETYESGQALVGAPGSSSLGLMQSGAIEGSNVDLTEQLVNMITTQRNFQANAQVISTADTVTQAIINIR